nr:nucleotide-binding alpha-beta plait domain-containing protein [Tanacetum cinerariifolium]
MVHKSYSSIFVSNIPWKARVQDLWDSCNQWGVVIDVYIAAKRSKSGHWFGFVCFKNVNDINLLVSNLKVTWMGEFHLFANVAKYGRTNNRLEERSEDSKPNEGMNTQPVRDNANVFQSFNSYAKAVLGNKSVGVNLLVSNLKVTWMGGFHLFADVANGEKPMGVSVSNKTNEESSNEALMFISEDDCIDLDGMERSILAKVKDLSVITDLLKYMSSEGFVDVGLRYVGGRWVWLEFDSTDHVESVKNSKVLNELFLELKAVSYDFIPDERCVWIDLDDEGPSLDGGPKHEEPLDIDNCDSVSSKDDNNDSDSSSEMSSTSWLMREVDVRGVDSDHVDSFEEGYYIKISVGLGQLKLL